MMEIKSIYKLGDSISFAFIIDGNEIKFSSLVLAIEQSHIMTLSGLIPDANSEVTYIVENEFGINPDEYRIKKYNFDKNKKYIFVKESEII